MSISAPRSPGQEPLQPARKLSVTCADFKPLRRNTLLGFATIHVAELRLTIHDVAVHQKGAARWAQLPANPQIRDGSLVKDGSGKVQYFSIMEFDGREVRDAFSRAACSAVLERAPHAFDEELGP
jgi:hypothetical protein